MGRPRPLAWRALGEGCRACSVSRRREGRPVNGFLCAAGQPGVPGSGQALGRPPSSPQLTLSPPSVHPGLLEARLTASSLEVPRGHCGPRPVGGGGEETSTEPWALKGRGAGVEGGKGGYNALPRRNLSLASLMPPSDGDLIPS